MVEKRTTNNKEYNNKELQQQQEEKPNVVVVVSSSSSNSNSKPKPKDKTVANLVIPMFEDTGWETLTKGKIEELIEIATSKKKRDILDYFRYWKKEIDKKPKAHNKPGYLIEMVRQGNDPPIYEDEEDYHPPYEPG